MPPVLIAEYRDKADGWLWQMVLPPKGWTYPARLGKRPATAPGWRVTFRLDPPELSIVEPDGVLFFTGPLPERWTYAAGELGWCVVYLVVGTLHDTGDPITKLGQVLAIADRGQLFSARIPIARQ